LLDEDSSAKIIVLGDLNDFEFSPPLDVLTDGGALTSLIGTAPTNDRYSFNFDGNSQVLDHILVSPALLPDSQADFVHLNIDFPAKTGTADERSSDHDPVVARFKLAAARLVDGVVFVSGDNLDNNIEIAEVGSGRNKQLEVVRDGEVVGLFPVSSVDLVRVEGLVGNDTIVVDDSVRAPVWLFGGDGDDVLDGGKSRSLLVGGDGRDTIFGGKSQDVLIGGLGEDLIFGQQGEDLLIGGATTFDDNDAALAQIFSLWTGRGSYKRRIERLAPLLNESTVIEDNAIDQLYGEQSDDWFLIGLGDLTPDLMRNERVS
jgi:Ca2+-binding RTX toxin-like protein